MEESQNAVLARVQAAAMDGRMRTLRIRQRLFQSLYRHLSQNQDAFLEAAQSDDNCSVNEAQITFASALIELRNHYNALDLTTDMDQEYSLAKEKSNEVRRVPIDITYIIPDTFTMLFSALSALSAAIEAGSCVVVEASPPLPVKFSCLQLAPKGKKTQPRIEDMLTIH
jgi:acyl-CoA reductase-like NAD-dependent aldehyde dehydrogenase